MEITETTLLDLNTDIVSTLNLLKAAGTTISLDDFGTGYSSLSYLGALPIDILQIDKIFTSDIALSGDSRGIVTAIIAMAKSLKMNIIVEGVKVVEQVQFFLYKQVELVQGLLFSPALPGEKFLQFLNSSDAESNKSYG